MITSEQLKTLKKLCSIHAPSGEEYKVRDFLIEYIKTNSGNWKQKPELYYGDAFQDCLLVKLGNPTVSIMSHMDSIGFTAGYNNELIPIGSPATCHNGQIVDETKNQHEVYFDNVEKTWNLKTDVQLQPGSTWTWKPSFEINEELIESPFLDNRLGIFSLLQIAPNLQDTVLAFSTYEEMQSGGKAGFLTKYMYENWKIQQVIIADITWITDFIKDGKGVAISMRDVGIPRKKFRDKIVSLAKDSGIPFQLEIEKAGGSDGTTINKSDYPIDWIFIGAPEENPHGYIEKVHIKDAESMAFMLEYIASKL